MASKNGNFLINNIEKIILPIIGIVCLWLLVTKVIITPNSVEYAGRELSPGAMDEYILEQAQLLQIKLEQEPRDTKVYEDKLNEYVAVLKDSVDVDTSLWPVVPATKSEDEWDGRQYVLPEPPQITDAKAEYIRAMAYLPVEEVTTNKPYDSVQAEPNDLDMVTVEARLNIKKLSQSFYDAFAGSSVNQQWRDEDLAEPVFAAVQLQRAEKLQDGTWSQWQDVPRLKIDHQKQLLEIIEDVNNLPRGGMKVRLLRYDNKEVQKAVLRPGAYDIASAEEDWFPPTLHEKFASVLRDQKAQERREEMERRREERQRELEAAKQRSTRTDRLAPRRTEGGRASSRSSSGGGGGGMGPSMGGGGGGGRSSGNLRADREKQQQQIQAERERKQEELQRRREEERETIDDVYSELEELLTVDYEEFLQLEEPALFWAHDDTVEPGKTYRYRIRLGVFNPLADTRKLAPEYESYKDQVIIWSNFEEAGTIEVPKILYFFAKDIREAANTVTVEVFKYALGYWRNKQYAVQVGEAIGKVDTPEEREEEPQEAYVSTMVGEVLKPDKVDFRTGVMMVDTAVVEDWTGQNSLRSRSYFNMYYSYAGSDIESTPIQQRFWPSSLQSTYNEIRSAMREPMEPPRSRGGTIEEQRPGGRPSGPSTGPSMGPSMGPRMGPRMGPSM